MKERLFGDWFPEATPEWYLEGKSTTFENIEFYHFEVLEDGYGTSYFVGGDFDDTMYYHGNDRDIYSMDVDIDSYIQLLAKTHGLIYWQKVIVDIKNKNWESEEYQDFETNMKVVNPEFKMSEFEVFYNSIRLNQS